MNFAPFSRAAFVIAVGATALGPVLLSATADPVKPAAADAAVPGPLTPLQIESIHNALQWSPNIISGSCPDGEAGYKALATRGVKTIITVDGAQPDAEVAKKYGMRYVHIPVEYSGIAHEDALKIIRAARDLPGPIFIHCHHGLHRGPAAAALVAITLANYSNDQATSALKQAGTGANYKGLWAVVKDFMKPTAEELNKADNSFPSKAPQGSTVAAMINIDGRWDNMKAVKKAEWKVPAGHPDVDPAHEALLLREAFRELARLPQTARYPADYVVLAAKAETAAADLETALRAGDATKAATAYDAINASCGGCHKMYRDNVPVN